MKKIAAVVLTLSLLCTVGGCAKNTAEPPSSSHPVESRQTNSWDSFVEEMEKQDIPYETLHTLENSGMRQEDIMKMSPEDIRNGMKERDKIIEQNKMELAGEMLSNPLSVKQDPQFVYTDDTGTQGLSKIEECIASIKRNDWGSFTGLMIGDPIPIAYELSYRPDGEVTLTTYTNVKNLNADKKVVTDIYEAETFYQFTDNKTFSFSIPKISLYEKELIESYQTDTDLIGSKITAAQAKETVIMVRERLENYLNYIEENDIKMNAFNPNGAVIPEKLPPSSAQLPDSVAIADGAANIQGEDYYRVSFHENNEFAGDAYYINAQNGKTVFQISMVGGELIPIGYENVEHYQAVGAK